jgi:hypothetical protein
VSSRASRIDSAEKCHFVDNVYIIVFIADIERCYVSQQEACSVVVDIFDSNACANDCRHIDFNE